MYETITQIIPLITDTASSRTIALLEDRINQFVGAHPDHKLNCYAAILNQNGLEWSAASMMHADVSTLDGRCVMALLVGAYRADQYCGNLLLDLCKNGCIKRWLSRLAEIDLAGK